ncbi:hypothetical protein [Aeromonas enteropelogenes]|uniref:hypothetical protein n=1 Tax=Aeromonas enteropelogenes TaxID=29489 RepID=UPI003B9EAA09
MKYEWFVFQASSFIRVTMRKKKMRNHQSNNDQQALINNIKKDWKKYVWKGIKLALSVWAWIDRLNRLFGDGGE